MNNRTCFGVWGYVCDIDSAAFFALQILHGEEYADNFNLSITKERTLKGTRGNILDRNGKPMAYNQLSYSIILEDNGTYDTTREKKVLL